MEILKDIVIVIMVILILIPVSLGIWGLFNPDARDIEDETKKLL